MTIVDERTTFEDGSMFHSPIGLLDFQAGSIASAYLETDEGRYDGGRLIVWDTGCIYGDAEIIVNRGGNGRRYSLREVVAKFNGEQIHAGKRSYGWDLSIPTYVQREAEDGTIRLGRLVRAQVSGVKQTYTLTTATGRTIRATDDHQFMTERGWVALGEIVAGDLVHVRGAQAAGGVAKAKADYLQVSWLRAHPYANRRTVARSPHRVPRHRLVAEADLNGLSYETFIARIKADDVSGLEFLDPEVFAVHHKDHDHRNNDLSNLMVMTHSAHHRLHADEGKTSSVLYKVATEEVFSVEPYGMEETFDLTLEDEPHNFVADGFVVHNCGKSIFGLRMATLLAEDAANGVRRHDLTIVLAERGKVSEWVDDFATFTTLSVRKHLGPGRWKWLEKNPLPDVLVTTYETAKLDLVSFEKAHRGKKIVPGKLFRHIEDLNVLWLADEMGAKLANRTSATYKAFDWTFRQMRKKHPHTHRAFGLTATPAGTERRRS